MLTIGGVSAENIDDSSSVVAESPISADLDTSLSSCDAQNNDVSSYKSHNSIDCDYSFDSLQSFDLPDSQIFNGNGGLSYSSDSHIRNQYVGSYDVDENQVACESCGSLVSCDFDDSYVSLKSFCTTNQINENIDFGFDVEGVTSTEKVVDNKIILENCNSFSDYEVVIDSTNNLDEINIFDSATRFLSRYENYIEIETSDSIISEVTVDMGTSESYKFGSYVSPQADNLLGFAGDDTDLDIVTGDLSGICQISEPVCDSILISSGYISNEEVYFGTISDSDWNMLLEYVGAENTILFASLTEDWNSNVASDILNVASNGNLSKINLDGYKIANALLKYYPSANEVHISLISNGDNEDEHSHVINDTNSHGLDYAYIKHVNVIYKDMPNLLVLTSSGYVSNKRSTAGSWDSLNGVLGSRMSSETLLPDHKAIWTPLLLLLQQDLQESIVNSHADDNKNLMKDKNNNTHNDSNSSCNHSHKHGKCHHYHKHWGHRGYHTYSGCLATNAVTADLNEHDNSTDDKNESNVTATGRGKSIKNSKANIMGEEPTYTLIYAIIGIILVSLLFNSSYMKND